MSEQPNANSNPSNPAAAEKKIGLSKLIQEKMAKMKAAQEAPTEIHPEEKAAPIQKPITTPVLTTPSTMVKLSESKPSINEKITPEPPRQITTRTFEKSMTAPVQPNQTIKFGQSTMANLKSTTPNIISLKPVGQKVNLSGVKDSPAVILKKETPQGPTPVVKVESPILVGSKSPSPKGNDSLKQTAPSPRPEVITMTTPLASPSLVSAKAAEKKDGMKELPLPRSPTIISLKPKSKSPSEEKSLNTINSFNQSETIIQLNTPTGNEPKVIETPKFVTPGFMEFPKVVEKIPEKMVEEEVIIIEDKESPKPISKPESPKEIQKAESPIMRAESPKEIQKAESPKEVQKAESPKEIAKAESPKSPLITPLSPLSSSEKPQAASPLLASNEVKASSEKNQPGSPALLLEESNLENKSISSLKRDSPKSQSSEEIEIEIEELQGEKMVAEEPTKADSHKSPKSESVQEVPEAIEEEEVEVEGEEGEEGEEEAEEEFEEEEEVKEVEEVNTLMKEDAEFGDELTKKRKISGDKSEVLSQVSMKSIASKGSQKSSMSKSKLKFEEKQEDKIKRAMDSLNEVYSRIYSKLPDNLRRALDLSEVKNKKRPFNERLGKVLKFFGTKTETSL
jgi:hypothetical protein